MPEMKTTARIKIKIFKDKVPMICWIATAAPVRVFEIT